MVSRKKGTEESKRGEIQLAARQQALGGGYTTGKEQEEVKPMERISKVENKPHTEAGFQLLKGHSKHACTFLWQ